MRASRQEQIGMAGQKEAAANFERLQWGPVANPDHDVGTDLFLQVRDARGVDLGVVVGAQVKSGPTAFAEAEGGDTGVIGWWFRDSDRRHVDAWLRHTIAHLIVLHDLETKRSYWAHVTREAVVPTGKGAKILVPADQLVDEDNREALLEVAGANVPGIAWEGSVWTAGADILPRDLLRHSLITPRLVAPHPNAGVGEPISAEQAIALLMQAQLSRLDRFAEKHASVPDMRKAHKSPDWTWRLAGALHSRVVDSQLEPILRVVADAPSIEQRAAATVAAASGLIELGRVDEALPLLDVETERDEAGAVDHAWLLVQRARARAEVGDFAGAQDDALRAQGVRLGASKDATASAIAASAAMVLFSTAAWGDKDLRTMLTSADTAASWWRRQTIAAGLWAVADQSFANWSRGLVTGDADDAPGHNHLAAAALMAGHAGDHGGWRAVSAVLATSDLLHIDRFASSDSVASTLTELRRAGDHRALRSSVKRIVADGPAVAAAAAAAAIELNESTRTTGLADLTLLEHAARVLDQATAGRTVTWLLRSLRDPRPFTVRTAPTYALTNQFAETLAGVIVAADYHHQRAVVEHLLDAAPIERQLDATAWMRVVRTLPEDTWTDHDASRAAAAVGRHHYPLSVTLQGVAARLGHEPTHAALLESARNGSIDALDALGDVRELPADVIEVQIAKLASAATALIADAHKGRHGFGHDIGKSLALLNIWHQDHARWDPLLQLLRDGAVLGAHKRGALRALSEDAERLSADVRGLLTPVVLALAQSGRPMETDERALDDDPFVGRRAMTREAALLAATLGALNEHETAGTLVSLLAGDIQGRVRAMAVADSLGMHDRVGMLIAFTTDAHPETRAWAAALLAQHADQDDASPVAIEALRAAAHDPGVAVAEAIAATLRNPKTDACRRLRESLLDHPSAIARRLARNGRSHSR